MAVILHDLVGLLHACMAIYYAYIDRAPVFIVGATGPMDETKRRPRIDWIHTARDQGALVRGYTKWDDQPASPSAIREAVLRAGADPVLHERGYYRMRFAPVAAGIGAGAARATAGRGQARVLRGSLCA